MHGGTTSSDVGYKKLIGTQVQSNQSTLTEKQLGKAQQLFNEAAAKVPTLSVTTEIDGVRPTLGTRQSNAPILEPPPSGSGIFSGASGTSYGVAAATYELGLIIVNTTQDTIKSQILALKVQYKAQQEQMQKWINELQKAIEAAKKANEKGAVGKVFSWMAPAISAVTEPVLGVTVTQADIQKALNWALPITSLVVGTVLLALSPFTGGMTALIGASFLLGGVFGIIMQTEYGKEMSKGLADAFLNSGIAKFVIDEINSISVAFGGGSIDVTPEQMASYLAMATVGAITLAIAAVGFGYGIYSLAASLTRTAVVVSEEAALGASAANAAAGGASAGGAAAAAAGAAAQTASLGATGFAMMSSQTLAIAIRVAGSVVTSLLSMIEGSTTISTSLAEGEYAEARGRAAIAEADIELTTTTIKTIGQQIATTLQTQMTGVKNAIEALVGLQAAVPATRAQV